MKYIIIVLVVLGFLSLGVVFYSNTEYITVDVDSSMSAQIAPNVMEEKFPEPLINPPKIIKAVYLTSWSAGLDRQIDYVIDLTKTTEINAVVIDVKDFSGYVSYDIPVPEVEQYGGKEERIGNINALVRKLHNAGVYVIARISVFQDQILAEARPDIAVRSSSTGGIWRDRHNLAWVDPAARDVWAYNVKIAKDVIRRGFDELNFDYVRFPTDGNLTDITFPIWDEVTPMHTVIKSFFAYLRFELGNAKLSVDLFGDTTTNRGDLGIGQLIEDAYEYFDVVAPMVYPSHYGPWVFGFENPAEHPYEIIWGALTSAVQRFDEYKLRFATTTLVGTTTSVEYRLPRETKLRPWLQDFDLGADYDASMVRAEIDAVIDAMGNDFAGFMLWNSENIYTKEAFIPNP